MTLSDEDYGILYNAIAATPHGYGTHFATTQSKWEVVQILAPYVRMSISACECLASFQQFLDFASFIILSEGRELP